MKPRNNVLITVALLCLSITPLVTTAADKPIPSMQAEANSASHVDNSRMNMRDKAGNTETPQDQSNSPEDRRVLALVRKAIVQDKSLSISAHNVKIMAAAGAITLRGPVLSNDEKMKIEKLAHNITGVKSIDNQLDVKTN